MNNLKNSTAHMALDYQRWSELRQLVSGQMDLCRQFPGRIITDRRALTAMSAQEKKACRELGWLK